MVPRANVHQLIMSALPKDGKYVIDGDDDDFEELLNLISEEIGDGLCSKKDAMTLLGVCKKFDPASLDWIGA